MGLDEYTVEGEAIRRFSYPPLEQIDRMLASLEARLLDRDGVILDRGYTHRLR